MYFISAVISKYVDTKYILCDYCVIMLCDKLIHHKFTNYLFTHKIKLKFNRWEYVDHNPSQNLKFCSVPRFIKFVNINIPSSSSSSSCRSLSFHINLKFMHY